VRITNAALCRRIAVVVAAAGLTVAGCASNPQAPSAASPKPSAPAESPPMLPAPQPATLQWMDSTCQALRPAFDQLGTPPHPDVNDLPAMRQAYLTYLENARNATRQAIDRLFAVGAPPVANGPQVLDQTRNQLTQLRQDLDDALAQLRQADPHDISAVGRAVGAAGNVMGALGNRVQVLASLASDPQLRAAINQTPECQNLIWTNPTTNQPTTGSQQPPG
jgi:hypothetical protein